MKETHLNWAFELDSGVTVEDTLVSVLQIADS